MEKVKRMFILALVVCALTTSIVATTAMLNLPTHTPSAIKERRFQPMGDPVDGPGPGGSWAGILRHLKWD